MPHRLALAALLLLTAACVKRAPEPEPLPPAPATPQAPPPIDIPRREGTPTVMLPLEVEGAPLLSPEAQRLRRWAARHLATQTLVPLDVLPLEQVDEAIALGQSRHLTPGGPECAAPAPPGLVLQRAFPDTARGHARATCDGQTCNVQVWATRGQEVLSAWTAPVAAPFAPRDFELALQALSPSASPAAPAQAEEDSSRPKFAEIVRLVPQNWLTPPGREELLSYAYAFEQCHEAGRPARAPDSFTLAVNAHGGVDHCAAYGSLEVPEHYLQCACQTLEGLTFDEGPDGRRVAFVVQEHPEWQHRTPDGIRYDAALTDFASSDAAVTEGGFTSTLPWAGLCMSNSKRREPLEVPVKLKVDAQGYVAAADLGPQARASPIVACIEGYVRNLLFPCTLSGQPAEVSFTLRVERKSAPPQARR